MRLFSYVITRDYGFAPNPFFGACTLATCKPQIRGKAKVGDWILGTGSKTLGMKGQIIFAMKVEEAFSFDQYWSEPRFQCKRPTMTGSMKQAFGDNIYHRDSAGGWLQLNSHHSLKNGRVNQRNIARDTSRDRVLISSDFAYWGGSGPKIPQRLRNFQGKDICAGRGHQVNFPPKLVDSFVRWFRSLNQRGYLGDPREWAY